MCLLILMQILKRILLDDSDAEAEADALAGVLSRIEILVEALISDASGILGNA